VDIADAVSSCRSSLVLDSVPLAVLFGLIVLFTSFRKALRAVAVQRFGLVARATFMQLFGET
jgi:hypothetical protein